MHTGSHFVTEHCLMLITLQLQAHRSAVLGPLWKSYWRGEGFLVLPSEIAGLYGGTVSKDLKKAEGDSHY